MRNIPFIVIAAVVLASCGQSGKNSQPQTENDTAQPEAATVYLTRDISPEALVKIYKALALCRFSPTPRD